MDRRLFLSWVGVGCLASSLPVAIAACTPDSSDTAESPSTDESSSSAVSPNAPESPPREDGFTPVGEVSALNSEGFIASEVNKVPILVIRAPEAGDKLIAFNSTCAHQGCKVEWKQGEQLFVCPCHSSKFKPDGTVANGPADKPLSAIEVKTEANAVLVKTV